LRPRDSATSSSPVNSSGSLLRQFLPVRNLIKWMFLSIRILVTGPVVLIGEREKNLNFEISGCAYHAHAIVSLLFAVVFLFQDRSSVSSFPVAISSPSPSHPASRLLSRHPPQNEKRKFRSPQFSRSSRSQNNCKRYRSS
jgi:hypothetical protein